MAILDPNEINNTVFEPNMSNRFRLLIDGIPAYMIKSVSGIGWDDGETIIYYINTYFKTRARRMYNDITLSLYDPVAPSGAQALEEKGRLAYERATARAGYSDFVWFDATLQVVGPPGDVVREWVIKKAFLKTATFGDYDYENAVYTTMQVTLANSGIDLVY